MMMEHSQLWWWGWSEPWIRARRTLDLNVDKRKRSWLGFSFCLTSYSDWKLRGWGGEKLFGNSWFCFQKGWLRCWLICYLFFVICSSLCADSGLNSSILSVQVQVSISFSSNSWYSSPQRNWPCLLLIQDGQSAFRFVHTRPRMVAKIHLCKYRNLCIERKLTLFTLKRSISGPSPGHSTATE